MREIKYRCWIEKYKEFKYWGFINGLFVSPPTGSNISIEECKENSTQYTGLKDKNGKDIYDGDFLRMPPESQWEETNYAFYEVFFHDGDANADYNIGFSIARIHYKGSVCGGIIPHFKPKQVSKMVVIGNIYENPELQ